MSCNYYNCLNTAFIQCLINKRQNSEQIIIKTLSYCYIFCFHSFGYNLFIFAAIMRYVIHRIYTVSYQKGQNAEPIDTLKATSYKLNLKQSYIFCFHSIIYNLLFCLSVIMRYAIHRIYRVAYQKRRSSEQINPLQTTSNSLIFCFHSFVYNL